MSFQGHILEPTDATMVGLEQHAGESSDGRSWFPNRIGSGETALFPRRKGPARSSPGHLRTPENKHRCLILCFDGTGDQFDADNSNIVQLQMVYYQAGIGTYTSAKMATPLLTKISLMFDTAIAWDLDSHVMAGYEFLMQNCQFCRRPNMYFGFSRGAYIARSLAGMIHKVGLLPVDNHQQVPFAYRIYSKTDKNGWEQSNAFKKAFSNDVHIDFIGVWDTVDSVGLIPKRLPFTTSNTIVRTFRHAVSLDERRAKFKANLWNFPNDKEKKLGTHTPPETPTLPHKALRERFTLPMTKFPTHFKTSSDTSSEVEQTEFETAFSKRHRKTRRTDVLEVWFTGCHCDVGGGSVRNDTRYSLARIPLRWMIRECFKADTGIIFDAQRLQELGLDPATLHPFVMPRPPPLPVRSSDKIESMPPQKGWLRRTLSRKHKVEADFPVSPELESLHLEKPVHGMEEEEELRDALSPIYDQLHMKPFWWILELIPLKFRYQKRDDVWISESNFGRPRKIPHQEPSPDDHPHHDGDEKPVVNLHVHRSVKTRREARDAKGRPYVNRAHFHVEPHWVD
ncbi:hypothetical protein B0H14DRAFT_3086748 [Mycena olivaceomarginata]|nr:hypothetical protein B0H14DRAFT_3086748 [Mycena olivaceomarginata]